MNSRVKDLYDQMGSNNVPSDAPIVVNHGEPETTATGHRFKLSKQDILTALKRMPDEAVLWSQPGASEYDAKRAMKEELWTLVEKKVKTYMLAPDGKTLLEVK